MDNKKLFEAALSAKMSDYPFSDTKTVMNNIMERADKMKNHENAKQMKFTEITPEYIEPKKSHKAISVVAGIAGTAAVLTGAVFGLNWLSEHGGLKEGGIESSNGVGYHDTSEASSAVQTDVPCTIPVKAGEEFIAPTSNTVEPETLPDISELYGKAVQFHDATVWLNSAEYDGETFTARFSLLYTGDNYKTYSPEYVKLTVGTPIDYTTEKFSIEEVPEADSYTHRCTYSVPVKLESGKSYAMGIAYLNTDGKTTQPIEADKQHYKYVYKPMREFWELPNLTGMNIDDAAGTLQKLGINYSITRSESNEVPENCVIRTVPEAGAAVEKKSTIVAVYVSSDMPSSFETFAEAGEAYGYDLLDFGIGARIYTTSLYGCDIIQSSKYVDNYSESGTVTTTIGTQDSKSEKPELTTQTVLIADTPEDRISGLAQMNGFDPEKLEHESYFSDNLGLTVDTYYGREENVQGSLNTVDIWSLALIDDGNVLYVLSFENIGGLTDVLTGAMRVTDPRTGYWEGDDAIDILKQYAGDDYCFPFEKLEKEKVSYYDGDKWTNSDEIMFNFAVGEEGVPIKAITGGTVVETFSKNVPGYAEGIYITIQAADGRKWRYRHLSDFYVTEGDTVRAGDVIAAVGATGWCTGPCLTISFPEDEAEPTALEGGIVGIAQNIE